MIIALHGFQGLPEDWAPFSHAWTTSTGEPFELKAIDLWQSLEGVTSLTEWLQAIHLRSEFAQQKKTEPRILLGYSLGGRLALQILLQKPEVWDGAVLISTQPGLSSDSDRELRLQADELWARRWETESWDVVDSAWQQQPVLQTSQGLAGMNLPRPENRFDRARLAQALRIFSLGHQANLRSEIEHVERPILWLTGARDEKFSSLTGGLGASLELKAVCIENAGHRVPWDQPEAFQTEVQKFINAL
jgi:2-succinyl-6-hydroxy-2,4-cyclohexadiene-1-carboxylate synthase